MFYKFLIIQWSDDGNTVLDRKHRTIKRARMTTAKDYLHRLYPYHYIELDSISRTNERII